MGREIRRNQDFLISIGTGVMLFGLWSVVWTLIQLIINAEDITEILAQSSGLPGFEDAALIFYSYTIITMILDLVLRLYVGLTARAEGKGKKKTVVYLFFAALILIISVNNLSTTVPLIATGEISVLEFVVTIIVETTSIITTLEMIVASIRLRKLKKEQLLKEEQHAD